MSRSLHELEAGVGRLPFDRYVLAASPLCLVEVEGEGARLLPRPILRIAIPLGLHRLRCDVLRYWSEAGTPLAVGPDEALWSGVYWPRGTSAGGGLCADAWATLGRLRPVLWRAHLQGLEPGAVLCRLRAWSVVTHDHGGPMAIDGRRLEDAPIVPLSTTTRTP